VFRAARAMISFPVRAVFREKVANAAGANRLIIAVLTVLSVALLAVAMLSLRWRVVHDLPIMMYLGFLMDRFGYVPYRDFFDFNMPGMHIVSFVIGRTIGYSDLGLRIFDLGYLALILIVTWMYMRKLGVMVGWAGSVLCGVCYLWYGPYQSLQREYILILPLALAVWIAFSDRPRAWWVKPAGVGLMFGLAATIKLHAAIGLPMVLWYVFRERDVHESATTTSREKLMLATVAVASFLLPLAVMLVYLWVTGALAPFWQIATQYWPLYAGLALTHQTIFGWTRVLYLIERYAALGGHGLWVMPAVIGMYCALFCVPPGRIQRLRVVLLAGMMVLYSIYPVIAGQFWSYHWLLFQYFVLQVGALCLIELRPELPRVQRVFPVAAFLVVIALKIAAPHEWLFQEKYLREVPKGGKVDEIAAFLKANLRPDDTVQPLDWANGAVHGMLIARARIATRFVYAFSFYHHISNPYIKGLRREFLAELERARPRFVIRMLGGFPWVHGLDTTEDFADLDKFIERDYQVAYKGNEFLIYERLGQR